MNQDMQNLIERCAKGESGAQKALFEKYKARFYAVCLRYASNSSEAQDILTEGFLKIFNSIGNYRGDGDFEGWMYKIFVNQALDNFHRTKHNNMFVEAQDDVHNNILTDNNTAFSSEEQRRLVQYLHNLNAKERTIFNMVVMEEYSILEAAKELQVNPSVVKTYYYRARAKLQDLLLQNEKELLKEYNLVKE